MGAVTLGVWWKIAGASEPPTHDFTWVGVEQVYAWMTRFTGHDPTAPIGAFTPFTGTSANPTSPSVTTTVAGSLLLRLGAFDDDDITVDTTGLAGHTTITMDESGTGTGTTSGGAGYVLQPAAGPSGTRSFALTASRAYRTVTLAIVPAIPAATSAVAEIDANSVAKASIANAFLYDIDVTIAGNDTGVDVVTIDVPPSFGLPAVNGVTVGGSSVPFTDSTSGHLIRIGLATRLISSNRIQIAFTADGPSCPAELGDAFRSTVDDSAAAVLAQNTTEGDGDGDPVDNNSWTVVTTGPACWYPDAGYQYRKRLCLDGAQIAGNHSHFPVLVTLTDPDLTKALSSGYDVLFTGEDGVTRLDFEREAWNKASGSLLAWVRFAQLTAGADKAFYIYYGNPSESSDPQNPPAVWDTGHKAVLHLQESGNGTLDEFRDSTANANHGRGGDGVLGDTPVQIPGLIGTAQAFDGGGDFIGISKVEGEFNVGRGTISAWFTLLAGGSRVITELRTDNNNHISLWFNNSTGLFRLVRNAGGAAAAVETAVFENGVFHALTLTWDQAADELKGYIDGVQIGTTQTGVATWVGALNGLGAIGAQPTNGHPFPHEGRIDEVRISDVVRSADWVSTCYRNEINPSSFLKCVGPEEPLAVSTASISSATDQTFTVGFPSTPAATMYVTDGQTPVINATDNIIIRIPATFPMLWNTGITTVTLGGTAAGKVSSSVTYEAGNRGVILDVTIPFAPGDFISVSGLRFTGFTAVSAPDNLELDVVTATDLDDKTIAIQGLTDVSFFTATATDLSVELEWVSPPFGLCADILVVRRLGALPTRAAFDWSDVVPCPAVPGTKQSTIDSPPSNDTSYDYGIFVHDGAGGYSTGKFLKARPFDSNPGPAKFAYSTGATSMAPPGLRFFAGSAIVYAVSNDSVLHSIRGGAAGGTWPSEWIPYLLGAPAQARPPVVSFTVGTAANGVAFAGSQDGKVYAINADDGSETWSRSVATMVQGAPAGNFLAYHAMAKDLVLVGTRNSSGPNSFVALNVADGSPSWSFDNSVGQGGDGKAIGIISGSASVDYATRRAFFASRQKSGGSSNTVWCVDFDTGAPTLVWSKGIGNVDGSPLLYAGVVYVGTNAGQVYALDPATGYVRWSLPLGDGPIKGFVFPHYGTNNVLVATSGNIWSIADNGGSGAVNPGWPVSSVPSPSTPLNVPGTSAVLVGSSDGNLYQFDATTALPVGSILLGDGSASVGMPTMDLLNMMIYVGSDQGVVHGVTFPIP